MLSRLGTERLVLLLGANQAHTPLPWSCLEGIPDFLRDRGWVRTGSKFSTDADEGTLDAYLKKCLKRSTANWVAEVLRRAGVVEISAATPVSLKLNAGW